MSIRIALLLAAFVAATPIAATAQSGDAYLPLDRVATARTPRRPLKERVFDFVKRATRSVPHLRGLVPPTRGDMRLGVLLVEFADAKRPAFDARDFQSQEPVEVPSWKVRVSVDWSEEKPGAEAVEIERLGASGPKSHRFMYGTIPEGGEFLSIDLAMDRFWVFAMYGEIRSEERISGREFLAKNKEDSQTAFHGSWQMRWLSD